MTQLVAESLWFQEVGYLPVFLLRLTTQGLLWLGVTVVTIVYFRWNLKLAQRLKYPSPETDEVSNPFAKLSPRIRRSKPDSSPLSVLSLRLRLLLPLTLGLSALVGLLLTHYGQLAVSYWQQGNASVPNSISTFNLFTIWQAGQQISTQVWSSVFAIVAAIAVLIYPQVCLNAIAVILSTLLGFIAAQHWGTVLQHFKPTGFNATEPLFDRDIGFYIFNLPFIELLVLWLTGLTLYGFLAVTLTYLTSGNSLSEGRFLGFSPTQQRHLFGVSGGLIATIAFGYWLSCSELVYSPRGITFGASYTDVTVQLPIYIALGVTALTIALYLFWRCIFWRPKSKRRRWVGIGLAIYGVLAVAGIMIPEAVQSFAVQPNELVRERPYIERTIALTRQASITLRLRPSCHKDNSVKLTCETIL
jgi:uncharacterized protein